MARIMKRTDKEIIEAMTFIKKQHNGELPYQFGTFECAKMMVKYLNKHSTEQLKPLLLRFFVSGMENVKCDNCGDNPNGKSFDKILSENENFIKEFFKI